MSDCFSLAIALPTTVGPPLLHELPTFLKHIAPPVSRFYLIGDDVRQCSLAHEVWRGAALRSPVFECAPEAVHVMPGRKTRTSINKAMFDNGLPFLAPGKMKSL